MSQYDTGLDIAGSFASGMRMAALREQLKQSRLERAEFELTADHRRRMRELELARAEAEANRSHLAAALDETNLQTAKMTQKSTVKGERMKVAEQSSRINQLDAQRIKAEAETEGVRAQNEENQKTFSMRQQLMEEELGSRKATRAKEEAATKENLLSGVLKSQQVQASVGQNLAMADNDVTPEDALNAARLAMQQAGVDSKPGDANEQYWVSQIMGQVAATKQELKVNQEQVKAAKAYQTTQLAEDLASKAMRTVNPEGAIEVFAEVFGDQPEAINAAREMVRGGVQSKREAELGTATASSVNKLMDESFAQRTVLTSTIRDFEAREETGQKLGTREKRDLAVARKKLEKLDKEIMQLRESLLGPSRKGSPKADVVPSEVPRVTTMEEYQKLPSGAEYEEQDTKGNWRRMRKP